MMEGHNRRFNFKTRTFVYILLGFQSILAILSSSDLVQACGPGRAGGRRFHNRLRKYPPLVQRQYIPNVSENTFGASGAPEGPIKRHDKRFKELVQNWNPDIEFRDDERTGADRMMSQRLKEKLSVLAISVMNQWPNVRLRVIEGWDEDRRHSANSLHYEGRAVDITTSDKDRSKYGLLARLAVEAGFDWVHYESRSHVHCSVKSEKADSIRNNGCFDAESLVETPMGRMEMSRLQTNDKVLTMNAQTGELQFSPVLMWLDRDESASELYVSLRTKSGKQIRLTSSHLIYLADEPMPPAVSPANVNVDLSTDKKESSAGQTNADSNGGSTYYYDFYGASDGPPSTKKAKGGLGKTSSESKLTGAPVAGSLGSGNTDSASSSENSIASRDMEFNEFIYTTYARNAVVGQYLLIHEPDESFQVVDDSIPQDDDLTEVEIPTRGSGVNRLIPALESSKYVLDSSPTRDLKMYSSRSKVLFDEIVSVDFVSKRGVYAPLTRDGNIVVNSVVASCYAVISDHDLAHWSMAPVRWIGALKEKLFNPEPETPASERTLDYIQTAEQLEERTLNISKLMTGGELATNTAYPTDLNGATTNRPNRTSSADSKHVHWYPTLLYNIARYVLPNNYLY